MRPHSAALQSAIASRPAHPATAVLFALHLQPCVVTASWGGVLGVRTLHDSRVTQTATSGSSYKCLGPARAFAQQGIDDVRRWSLTAGIDADDAAILVKNKITGAELLDVVTEEKLAQMGMPLGPSWRLMSAVAAIKRMAGGVSCVLQVAISTASCTISSPSIVSRS